jgi:hypothetical protein
MPPKVPKTTPIRDLEIPKTSPILVVRIGLSKDKVKDDTCDGSGRHVPFT